MDNSFRLQLLRTKRELQSTINQIDNILFYNNVIPQSRSRSEAFKTIYGWSYKYFRK